MSFLPYRDYKPSGVDGIGDIPGHWCVRRMKNVLSEPLRYGANEAADDDTPGNPRYVRITDIASDGELRNDTFRSLPAEIAEPYLLQDGDILLARSGATVGKSFIYRTSWGQCCFAGYLIRVRLAKGTMLPDYLYACCQSAFYWQYVGREQIQATIQNVSAEKYGDFAFPFPPLSEQIAIVAFLDRETAKIDALVEEQQRLICLLTERRQAIISQAVTKGRDPNMPMKDTGIEWLGKVPAHWEVRRLRFLCDIETGDADTVDAMEEGEYPFFVRSPVVERINHFTHDCEAVLTSGDGAGVGKIYHHFVGKFAAHQRVYIFTNFRGVSGRFFYNYLAANFHKVALEGGAKSTVDSLRRPLIANFSIVVPPLEEQERIVEEASELEARYDRLIEEAKAGIRLLQERRVALISAAVTGKMDVRNAVEAGTATPQVVAA